MKKIIASLSVLAAITSFGATSSWAFVSKQVATKTATATTTGTKGASFTLAIKDAANPLGADSAGGQIGWSGVNVDNNPTWKIADQIMKITWSVTDAKGGIQIYTDNTNATASPRFVDPSPLQPNNPDSNPAGLLQVTNGLNTSSFALDMAWSIKASTQVVGTEIAAADPNNGPTGGAADKTQWFFLLDKNTPDIDRNGDNKIDAVNAVNGIKDTLAFPAPTGSFVQMIRSNGIHTNQSADDSGYNVDPDKTSYVYFQADFSKAAAGVTYTTNKLTVEAFTE